MEYMSGGSLTDILDHYPALKMSEPEIALIMLESLKALDYMHRMNIIHRLIFVLLYIHFFSLYHISFLFFFPFVDFELTLF